jgi:hypothetical protein
VAWAPPIFPDAFGRFQLTPPAPAPRDLPLTTESGLLGGIARMLAEQATVGAPSDDGGYDLLGAIAGLPVASVPNGAWSDVAAQGLLGGNAKLQELKTDTSVSPLSPLGGALRSAADPSSLLLDNSTNPQRPPPSIGSNGFGPAIINNVPEQFPLLGDASFDASRNLISPPPSPQPPDSAPQSMLRSFDAHGFFAPAYMSGGVADSPIGSFDPRAWGWFHQAADREKADPEEIWDPLAPLRADLYNTARYNLREIQPNNYALSVPSLFGRPEAHRPKKRSASSFMPTALPNRLNRLRTQPRGLQD